MNKFSQNKIKAIKEDLNINVDDSLEDVAIRNNVELWVVEEIEDGTYKTLPFFAEQKK